MICDHITSSASSTARWCQQLDTCLSRYTTDLNMPILLLITLTNIKYEHEKSNIICFVSKGIQIIFSTYYNKVVVPQWSKFDQNSFIFCSFLLTSYHHCAYFRKKGKKYFFKRMNNIQIYLYTEPIPSNIICIELRCSNEYIII